MMRICELIPDPEALLALEPEELAGVVLQYLNSLEENSSSFSRYNFSLPERVEGYPKEYHQTICRALMEAWVYLEREGLLVPKPGSEGWFIISRRGKKLATPEDFQNYRKGNLLPRGLLHPRIAQKIWATFLRGDYDTAVFQSFKEVEVCVRVAAGFAPTEIGTALMRKAFEPGKGPLADIGVPSAEQDALAHLFAGSIGLYKNPSSHRAVDLEAGETVEIIMLASHLLSIVEKRSSILSQG
jgi:uncharacterized protein (TIGR02391 family)